MKKILFTRPNYSSQVWGILQELKNDPFFKKGKNYFLHEKLEYNKASYSKNEVLSRRELSKYDVIICDNNPEFLLGKQYHKTKKKQIMINLTHGMCVKEPNDFLYRNKKGVKPTVDYILSPNEYSDKVFEEMGYKQNQILKYAFPRMAYYESLEKKAKETVFKNLPEEMKKYKKVLFAPTWASFKEMGEPINYNLDKIFEEIGEHSVLYVSPHPLLFNQKDQIVFTCSNKNKNKLFIWEKPITYSKKDNLFDLAKAEDIMIAFDELYTDFSSIAYDFASLKSPKQTHFYSPIDDKNQNPRVIEAYNKMYKNWNNWNTGHQKIDLNKDWNIIKYRDNEKETSIKSLIIFLKKLLTENE